MPKGLSFLKLAKKRCWDWSSRFVGMRRDRVGGMRRSGWWDAAIGLVGCGDRVGGMRRCRGKHGGIAPTPIPRSPTISPDCPHPIPRSPRNLARAELRTGNAPVLALHRNDQPDRPAMHHLLIPRDSLCPRRVLHCRRNRRRHALIKYRGHNMLRIQLRSPHQRRDRHCRFQVHRHRHRLCPTI
jgi:hypothetical protein